MTITYTLGNNLYINLTNHCLNKCTYCIKFKWDGKFYGHNLMLRKEPSATEVINSIKDLGQFKEIVFCGYGEPLLRLEQLIEVAQWLKTKNAKTRLNTSGLANLYYKKNIVPELSGLIDGISISLNGSNPEEYERLNNPVFGKASFDAIIAFAVECRKSLPSTTITAVSLPGLDTEKIKKIAESIKVNFHLRAYLDETDNSGL